MPNRIYNDKNNLQELLENKTQELNNLVLQYSAKTILPVVLFAMQIHAMKSLKVFHTQSSPVRQIGYIVEIALNSKGEKMLTSSAFKKMLQLLEEIEHLYIDLQVQNIDSLESKDVEKDIIAVNYFVTKYFNMDLVYVEQAVDRYQRTFASVEEKIKGKIGLSLKDIDLFLRQVVAIFKAKRENAIDMFFRQNYTDEDAYIDKSVSFYVNNKIYYFTPNYTNLGITIEEMLPCGLGQNKLEKLFNLLTAKPSNSANKVYYGSKQKIDDTPFIEIENGSFTLFSEIQLSVAIYHLLMSLIDGDTNLSSKLRAKYLEGKTADCFRKFFDTSADIYTNYYVNEDLHEKDLLIVKGNTAYVIECKSDKMIEAFRNPEKSYTRIRRDFKTSIQKAFDQAFPVYQAITDYKNMEICDKNGNIKEVIDCTHITKTYMIIVTQERYGLYQNDLSLLLEKPSGIPFPYSVSIDDLETILLTLHRMPCAQIKLNEYLNLREKMNGKLDAEANDELDIAAEFILCKTKLLKQLYNGGIFSFSSHDCDLFDDLYFFNGIGFSHENYDNKFRLMQGNMYTYYICQNLHIRPTLEATEYMKANDLSFSKIMHFIEEEVKNKETKDIMGSFLSSTNKKRLSFSELVSDYAIFKEKFLRDKKKHS